MGDGHEQRLRLEIGEIDLASGRLHRAEGEVPLTTNEVALLRFLTARPGEAVSRHVLHAEV